MPELVTNLGSLGYCAWCDNTGQLSLRRWETVKNQKGEEYKEQVEAPCGFCELGHRRYGRHGGPWHYQMEDVDVTFTDEFREALPLELARRLEQASQAFSLRRHQMQLPVPRPPKLDAEAYEPGPGPAILGAKGQVAEPLHQTRRDEEQEP